MLSILLDSHPDLVVGPEIDFKEPINLGSHILEVCALMACRDPRVIGTTKEAIDPEWFDGVHFVWQCERSALDRDEVKTLVTRVIAERGTDLATLEDRCLLIDSIGEFRRQQTGAKRWGLKLQRRIQNVCKYAAIWPQAHFIHIIRDGRDVAASHEKVSGWDHRTIGEAVQGRINVVTKAHLGAPSGRYLEVRYEDLVTAPRETAAQMLEYLGLGWSERVLHHAEHKHALFDKPWGHPSADAAAQPLYTRCIGRYVRDLTPQEVEQFERLADQLHQAGSLETGFLLACGRAPYLLLGPLAGLFADRFSHRILLITANWIMALTLATVPVSDLLIGYVGMPHLYTVATLMGGLTVIADVAFLACVPTVVPPQQLVQAQSWIELGQSAALVLGPPLAGRLIYSLSAPIAILADAASFLLVTALLPYVIIAPTTSDYDTRFLD
ncbi:MFS transporter, partial [Cupriavidus taiwanensis]|uniref:MFS transporter n=1 Tax=Cupriavidus taiwanensis TaxID=164546 RepID=UPI002162BBA9